MARGQGVELGRGYVSLAVSTKGLGREVVAEFGGVSKAADTAGTKAGSLLRRGIGSGAKQGAQEAADAAKKAASAQQSASRTAQTAMQAEEAAARKVTIAKKAHADAVAKYGEGSLQAMRTADRLATAELRHADAAMRAKTAEEGAAKATKDAASAKVAADQATQRYERSLGGLAAKLRQGIASPFAKLAGSADREGSQSSQRFGRALKAGVNGIGRTLQPFKGLSGTALSAGRDAASKLSAGLKSGMSKIGGLLKGGLLGVGAGAALSVGGVMTAGWNRFTGLEDAQAKLKGLGHTAAGVGDIMKSALASVKGTSHGMAEAASTAAGLVASGVKPGERLTQVLTTTGNAASIAGMDMKEMGAIFNKVAASGKAQGDVLAQLGDRGVPIVQWLAKEMGVTAAEVSKLASEGKINFETFEKAVRKGAGNAADVLGKTTTGSIKNFGASIGRLGEKIISSIAGEGGIAGAFQGMTAWVDDVTSKVEPAIRSIKTALEPLVNWLKGAGKILIEGDFEGGLMGLDEDHPIVDTLFRIREGFGDIVDFVKGAGSILIKGDFDGLLGLDEDDPIVDKLFRIREGFQDFWAGLTMDAGLRAEFAGDMDGMVEFGAKVRAGFDGVRDALTGLWAKVRPIVDQIVSTITKKWTELQPRVASIWEGIKGTVTSAIGLVQAVIKRVTDAISWVWSNFGSNIMRQIEIAMDTIAGVIDGTFKVIRGVFDVITGVLTGDWSKMAKGLESITDGLATSLGAIFRGIVGTLGNIWDGIKKVFAGPVNWVIDNVINPLIDGVNKVAEVFGAKWRAPRMARMATPGAPSATIGGSTRGGPSVQMLSDGGPVGGFSPHPKADNILAWLTADEEVIRVKAARRLRRKHSGLLEYMNREGDVPPQYQPHGYAGGGRIIPNATQGFANYNPTFLNAIQRWASATGRTWTMTGNGGARSFADQLRAWNLYQSGRGPLAANPYRGGPHMVPGRAMDLSPRPGEVPHARALLSQFGLGLTVRGEPWHVGWAGGNLGGGITSGGGGGFDPFGAVMGLLSKSIPFTGGVAEILKGLPGKLLDLGKKALMFDAGGVLPPGVHQVVNASGRPEAILSARQWEAVEQSVNNGLAGANIVYAPVLQNADPRRQYEQFMWDLARDAGRQVKVG